MAIDQPCGRYPREGRRRSQPMTRAVGGRSTSLVRGSRPACFPREDVVNWGCMCSCRTESDGVGRPRSDRILVCIFPIAGQGDFPGIDELRPEDAKDAQGLHTDIAD